MAAHSSNLAWRIPWAEEPGSHVHGVARVRLNFATKQTTINASFFKNINYLF